MTVLSLRFLGEIEITRGRERLALPQSKKTRALLAYLAVSGRPHRRDRLCSLFWDIPDDPRGALRWSLSKLRPLVNDADRDRIVADREHVSFDRTGAQIDLLAVEDAIGAGLDEATTDGLRALLDEFRGEFLEGMDLTDCPEFHGWCLAERERSRSAHVRVLAALVERPDIGPEEALAHARAFVQADPGDERAHAALISRLGEAGLHREAERQYRASIAILEELGHASAKAVLPAPSGRHHPAGSSPPGSQARVAPPERPRTGIARDLLEPAGLPYEEENDPFPFEQQIRFCTTSDGARIAYSTIGEGPPLVKAANWLNHLEFDWRSPVWRHLLRMLARDHLLVRYDERGNGLSDWDVENISFDAFVEDLETVVDAVGLDRFALLGISQGCAVSIAYAVRHPERVTRLVLHGGYAVGWAVRGASAESERKKALLTLTREGWGQENPAFRQVFTSLYVPDGNAEQMQWWNELQRVTTSPENAARLLSAFSQIDVRHLLGQISVPTLVTHSRGDAGVPFAAGRELAISIPGARFVPLESRNHVILEQEPAWLRFWTEVRTFLARRDSVDA